MEEVGASSAGEVSSHLCRASGSLPAELPGFQGVSGRSLLLIEICVFVGINSLKPQRVSICSCLSGAVLKRSIKTVSTVGSKDALGSELPVGLCVGCLLYI